MNTTRGLPAALFPLLAAGSALADEAPEYRGSRLERAALEDGYATVEVRPLGDDFAVVERGPRGYHLALVHAAGRRPELRQRLGPWPADGLERFETHTSTQSELRPEVVFALREDAPDEVVHRVWVLGREEGRLRPLFDRRFTFAKRRARAGEVQFGDAEPRWELATVDGALAVVWVRSPRVLTVPRGDASVTFGIGAETTVFRWEGSKFDASGRDVYRDFLPRLETGLVEARAGDAALEVTEATDDEVTTAWRIPASAVRARAGLTVQLARTEEVRMVRVVPGCAADAGTWRRQLEVGAFRLDLGGTLEVELDRRRPDEVPPGVKAWAEFPLSDAFGRQLVIFFDAPRRVGWARFEPLAPLETKRSARVACVSEISLH